jgi:hypothetical protein
MLSGFAATAATAQTLPRVNVPAAVAPAQDASLKSLAVTAPKGIKLAPKFKATVKKYSITVPAGTKKVAFKAVPTQAKAKVAIKAPKAYKSGANNVLITVTATDKKTKSVYTVVVNVLKSATVVVDAKNLQIVPGGFLVKVTLLNATIAPTVTVTSADAKCKASIPYAFVSAPDATNAVQVLVQGVVKGCTASLALSVNPAKGYAPVKVTPVVAAPTRSRVAFLAKPLIRTGDGFTVDYQVLGASISCVSNSVDNPDTTSIAFTQTKLTVSGLLVGSLASVKCTFVPEADTDGYRDDQGNNFVTFTSSPLTKALIAVGQTLQQVSGFTVPVTVSGCVPRATVVADVSAAKVAVTGPVKGVYSVAVTNLVASENATATITCIGITGQFADSDPEDVASSAVAATGLGVLTAPRLADATDGGDVTSEGDLPDIAPGGYPAIIYATTPEFSPWDASGKTTYNWQISDSDYDSDGNPCSSLKYDQNKWSGLKTGIRKQFPHILNVGEIESDDSSVIGRCVRIDVVGTFGTRTAIANSVGQPIVSKNRPVTCSRLPELSGNASDGYAVRGDVISSTIGLCDNALGMKVNTYWQVSTATLPSSDDDWTTMSGKGGALAIVSSMQGKWLRSQVIYTAKAGTLVMTSPLLAIAGTFRPVNSVIPVISGTGDGVGLRNANFTLENVGEWTRAAGAVLTVTWQLSTDGGTTWEDLVVLANNGDVIPASFKYTAKTDGSYRAKVTFSSQTGAFTDAVAISFDLSWASQ